MTNVKIGKFTCDKRVVDKTQYIADMQEYNCSIYDSCNVMQPVLLLRYNSRIFDCNYIQITEWKRYYYITNISLNPANEMIVSCFEDVLFSNMNEILNLDVNVIRNQNKRNKLLVDYEYPTEIMSTLTTLRFSKDIFNATGDANSIIMCVIGGKNNESNV